MQYEIKDEMLRRKNKTDYWLTQEEREAVQSSAALERMRHGEYARRKVLETPPKVRISTCVKNTELIPLFTQLRYIAERLSQITRLLLADEELYDRPEKTYDRLEEVINFSMEAVMDIRETTMKLAGETDGDAEVL